MVAAIEAKAITRAEVIALIQVLSNGLNHLPRLLVCYGLTSKYITLSNKSYTMAGRNAQVIKNLSSTDRFFKSYFYGNSLMN